MRLLLKVLEQFIFRFELQDVLFVAFYHRVDTSEQTFLAFEDEQGAQV